MPASGQKPHFLFQVPQPLRSGAKLGRQSQVLLLKLPDNIYDLDRGLYKGLARGIVYRLGLTKLWRQFKNPVLLPKWSGNQVRVNLA